MAINFLSQINALATLNLNQTQLFKAQIENQVDNTGAGTGVEGQLYFDTTLDVLKVWAGGAWAEVGGGVISLSSLNSTFINLVDSGDASNPELTASLSATGTAGSTTFLKGNNTWATAVTSINVSGGTTGLTTSGGAITTAGTITLAGTLNAVSGGTGQSTYTVGDILYASSTTALSKLAIGAAGQVLKVAAGLPSWSADSQGVTSVAQTHAGNAFGVTGSPITGAGTLGITMAGNGTQYINGLGNLITFPTIPTVGDGQINGATSGFGLSGSMSATANQSGNTTFTVASNATAAATVNTLMYRDDVGYSNVVTPPSGDSTTKIATTAFVQQSLTGLLKFKSGFDATTGAIVSGGNLTSGATRVAVAVGDYYVVTVAGNFFGNVATPLTPGDSVIVQTAAVEGASVEANFIVVQSDTDLATSTTVGIGNVVAATNVELGGLSVTYSNGTATVGLDIDNLPFESPAPPAASGGDIMIPYVNDGTTENHKAAFSELVAISNFATSKTGTIAIGALFGTVTVPSTWGLNTMVQTIDSSGNTVFCDISRTSTSVTATIAAVQATAITILVQKIG